MFRVHVEFFLASCLLGLQSLLSVTITQPKRYIGDMRLGDAGFGGIGTELDGYLYHELGNVERDGSLVSGLITAALQGFCTVALVFL